MASLYTHADENTRKTWFLITGFFVFVIAVGWLFSYVLESPVLLVFAVFLSVTMSVGSYWFSDKIVLSMAGAHLIEKKDNPELYRLVENLAITAGLPLPKIYIINEAQLNAFATGRDKNHAVVVVVLAGVVALLADFFLRISFFGGGRRRDSNNNQMGAILLVVGIVAAILAPLAATLIKLAISRKREFLADASGALLTRYPEGLASAL